MPNRLRQPGVRNQPSRRWNAGSLREKGEEPLQAALNVKGTRIDGRTDRPIRTMFDTGQSCAQPWLNYNRGGGFVLVTSQTAEVVVVGLARI